MKMVKGEGRRGMVEKSASGRNEGKERGVK